MEVLSMSNVVTAGLTTDEIFQRAPRLSKDDITEQLSEMDIETIEEFEDAWKEFLQSRPGVLPPGRKVKNFRHIQIMMNEIEGKKQNVCLELQRQLDFFADSKDKLEEKYKKAKLDATLQQEGVIKHLEQDIDDIATADKLLSEVLPWEHFFENLEANTTTVHNGSVASMSAGTTQSQAVKPSSEALYLANVQPKEVVYAARRGNSKAHLLRAYRIDNALLKAKAAMLRKEADRLEKTIRSERMLSTVLMDNDIWGIMAVSR
eukprot:jgi/Psemu1/35273/gm1.35273_g